MNRSLLLTTALFPFALTCLDADLAAQGLRKYPKGVDAKIEATIKRGLDYLVRTQDRSGAWRATGYGAYPTAMTALAGMALIGSGSTPTKGKY